MHLNTNTLPDILYQVLYDLDRRLVDTTLLVDKELDKAFIIRNEDETATCCLEPGDAGYNELNKIWRNR